MAISVAEIKKLKEYLVKTRHSRRVNQQTKYLNFYNDNFEVPVIQDKKYIVRTGKAPRMIDGVVEHIVTSSPQIFREAGNKEKDTRVSTLLNIWANVLNRQDPVIYKELPRNKLLFGESVIYHPHNPNYDKNDKYSLPVLFLPLNPMTVFIDDHDISSDGVPTRVIISYERDAENMRQTYPLWDKKGDGNVDFFAYWDEDVRYFEGAGIPVLTDGKKKLANGTGIQENPYKLVPFVHSYSGWGHGSIDGDPASMAIGKLHNVMDLLVEQCSIRSSINLLIYKFGSKPTDLYYRAEGATPTGNIGEQYSRKIGAFNVIGLPEGAEIKEGVNMLPDQALYQHLMNIESQIAMEDPPIFSGITTGSSGRQDDIARETALARYNQIVDKTAEDISTAMGNALKQVDKMNLTLPVVNKGDIGNNYHMRLELKAADPIANDRLSAQGRALRSVQEITRKTNLVKYQGYSENEADEEIIGLDAELFILNSPDIQALMSARAAEKMGMSEDIASLKARREGLEAKIKQGGVGSRGGIGAQGGEPRIDNIKTETGGEDTGFQRGVRRQPQ